MRRTIRLRRQRRRRGGQATVEFAFCLPLYLLVFFATIDAALWAIQTSACVSAAEVAARLAASVQAQSTCSPPSPSCMTIVTSGTETTPLAADVTLQVRRNLQQAMFGTTILPWCRPDSGSIPPDQRTGANCHQDGIFRTCPTGPGDVLGAPRADGFGDRVIVVCVEERGPPGGDPATDPPSVVVKVVGYLASLVPPAFGIGWRAGEIPIDIGARTHAQRFTT